MNVMKLIRATLALAVVATVTSAPVAASAAAFEVTPSAMGDWVVSNEDATAPVTAPIANGVFVAGPGSPVAGSGSFRQFAAQGHKTYLHNAAYAGAPLATLTLSYSTYSSDPPPTVNATYVNLAVDKNADGISDTTLVFEPSTQVAPFPVAAQNVWQTWTDAQTGKWYSTADGGVGGPFNTLSGWATTFAAANMGTPSVLATLTPQGAVRFVAGSSGTAWVDTYTAIDAVAINADTFDFEQDPLEVVHPGALGDWSVTSSGAASASFVLGPDVPPLGDGSQHQLVTGTGGLSRASNPSLAGTPLAGIDLKYATYVSARPNSANAPSMKIRVDRDGNGTGDETLVFEPYWQNGAASSWHASATGPQPPAQCVGSPCAKVGEWQIWDPGQGAWWSTSGGTGTVPHWTLTQYAKAFPGATIATLDSGPLLRIESGSTDNTWIGTDATIDAVTLNGAEFDFEPMVGALDCSAVSNDIAQVQSIVNSAPNGFVLELSGTCDFSAASAHGGDTSSLVNTAVLIRPGTPINGLTIKSAGTPQSATILGGGDEAAFAVAPGNSNVTIEGLTFRNLARAVVAINSDRTTIGNDAGLPSPLANRIVGGPTTREAILGMALDRNPGSAPSGSVILNYGAGAASTATFTGQGTGALTNFEVLGNYISYDPPGTEDGTNQVVAIAVRQRFQNRVTGVLIEKNAVGMFATEFPTTNMTGIQLHSFNSVPTSGPGDYLITDVEIDGNNLGRLEQLALDPDDFGVDPADVHAAGRTGIVMLGVSDFVITDNGVRVRESNTGPIPMPGGGIIVSDSGFGRIGPGNSSMVLADPSTAGSDFGAYGVVENFSGAFGSANKAQVTTDIVLTGNRIGTAAGGVAGRGFVATAGTKIVAHQNNFWNTSGSAANLGVALQGPGSIDSPSLPVTLPQGLSNSVVCNNNLDGTVDDASEVESGVVANSAFPGGTAIATDNVDCRPTITLNQTLLNNSSGNLTASGKAWPNRAVSVALSGGGSVISSGAADAEGDYSVTFTPAQWNTLSNGTLTAVATASDPSGASLSSAPATVQKDTSTPVAPFIGSPSSGLVPSSFVVSGTGPAVTTIRLKESGTLIGQTTSNASNQWSIALTGQSGSLSLQAFSVNGAGNESLGSNVVNLTVDASVPAPPIIGTPTCGSEVNSNDVVISGSTSPGFTVNLRRIMPPPPTSLGSVVADGAGAWSKTVNLADGSYTIGARAVNGVGTQSAEATCTFQVRTDFGAPDQPIIDTPAEGSYQPRLVDVTGRAEIGSTVRIIRGAAVLGTTVTGPDGRWSKQLGFTDGTHTIFVIARDQSGNDSIPSANRTFHVDGVRPRVTITTSELIPQVGDIRVQGTASDNMNVASVEVVVTDLLFGGTTTGTATLASPGAQLTTWSFVAPASTCICQVTATSYDAAGNRSAVDSVTIIEVG